MANEAFVSSTFEDLKEHRQVVIVALRKAGIFVDPMENCTASSDEPKKLSQERLEDCDLCVLDGQLLDISDYVTGLLYYLDEFLPS